MIKKVATVKGRPGLVRIDDSYIINTDEREYQAALLRRKNQRRLGSLEQRMSTIENHLSKILNILESKG